MPHTSQPPNAYTDITTELALQESAEASNAENGEPLTRGNLAWLDSQLSQIAPENNSHPQPDSERNIACDLSPGLPYAVINTALHDDIHCSPADAIVTWLHNWDPAILEQFLDTDANETIQIEQREEGEENTGGPGADWTPVVVLDRFYEQIRISYFENGSKTEYRVNVVEETGQWIPVHAVIDGTMIHGEDPAAKWAGALITARILYDEAWKTANQARLRVCFGGN